MAIAPALQVYFASSMTPSLNAGLVSRNGGAAGAPPRAPPPPAAFPPPCANATCAPASTSANAATDAIHRMRILDSSSITGAVPLARVSVETISSLHPARHVLGV